MDNILVRQLIREGFFNDQEAEAQLRAGISEILQHIADIMNAHEITCIHEMLVNNEFNTNVNIIVSLLLQEFKARSSAQYFLGEIFHETFDIKSVKAIEEQLQIAFLQYLSWKIYEHQQNIKIDNYHIQHAIELIKKANSMRKASMFLTAREKFTELQMFNRIKIELQEGGINIPAIGRVSFWGFLRSQFNTWEVDFAYIDDMLY